jgi:hypothetical protein
MPDSKATIEQVDNYVEKNVVPAQEGRKCVDGRYLPNQATGMIARPGGDCGYVMALMAVNKRKGLGMTPEQCFNAVYKVLANHKDKFCMHTDHHADPDSHTHKGLIGCGHLVKASTEGLCDEYDVDGEDVKRFVEYARNLAEIEPSMEVVNLDGEHEEKGVLVIKDDKYTINADNPDMKQMYFIYDEQRDNAFMKNLVADLQIDGVTFEDMKDESDIQLQATLHNLAMGLPIYSVEFIGSEPKATYIGIVDRK